MKTGHPISYILLAIVLIIDGGLGLVKIFLKRFFEDFNPCKYKNTAS